MTDTEVHGRIIRVTYRGDGGSYYDQPSPAEFDAECPKCEGEVDGHCDAQYLTVDDVIDGWCATGEHDQTFVITDPMGGQ